MVHTKRVFALWLAVTVACIFFATARSARAEHLENQVGRGVAITTLLVVGPPTMVANIASSVYLAGGSGKEGLRVAAGTVSLVGAGVLLHTSAATLWLVDEGNVPQGSPDGEAAVALRQARALAGLGFAFSAASFGVGLATLIGYDSDATESITHGATWNMLPIAMESGGQGIGLIGTF